MNTSTTGGRVLAIVAGIAFTAGGLTILLGEALTRPLEWVSYQWLTILTVFGTIAAGHLMVDAGRARHIFAMIGFLILFLSGTGLVVYSSVGRQVEAADTTILSVEDTNQKIVEKSAELASAKARRAYADRKADKEMDGEDCLKRCKDWRQNSKDISSVISQLEAEISALGPRKPVNNQASAMADVVLLFGVGSKEQIIAALTLLVPFAKCLFFEIGSIVSIGFAFRQSPVSALNAPTEPAKEAASQTSFPNVSDNEAVIIRGYFGPREPDNKPAPDRPKKPVPTGGLSKSEAFDDLTKRLADGQTIDSQDDLAIAWNRPKQTVSDWLREWRRIGAVPAATMAGRCKAIMPA